MSRTLSFFPLKATTNSSTSCLWTPFMRMNGVHKQEVEEFVVALSGKKLSVRDIEQLATSARLLSRARFSPPSHPRRASGAGVGGDAAGGRRFGPVQRV